MEYRIADKKLRQIDEQVGFSGGLDASLVSLFRRRMQQIRAVRDETDFYQLKSLHFEKLKGNRKHQRSMRLNDQYRLIVEIEPGDRSNNVVVVVAIEDYH